MTLVWQAVIRQRVPFVILGGSKEQTTITGLPILRVSRCGGMPGIRPPSGRGIQAPTPPLSNLLFQVPKGVS